MQPMDATAAGDCHGPLPLEGKVGLFRRGAEGPEREELQMFCGALDPAVGDSAEPISHNISEPTEIVMRVAVESAKKTPSLRKQSRELRRATNQKFAEVMDATEDELAKKELPR